MSCPNYENLVALRVAGDLPSDEAVQVQAHLHECESCQTLAEDLSSDLQWLQSAHQEPADRAALHQVRVGVMRQLESEQGRRQTPLGGLTAAGWRWQWVIVSALAILLGGVAWWVRPAEPPNTTAAADPSGSEKRRATANAEADAARPADAAAADQRSVVELHQPLPAAGPAADTAVALKAGGEQGLPGPQQPISSRPKAALDTPLAGLAGATPFPAGSAADSTEAIQAERQIEVVTARLPESPEAPSEAVMLKMPTHNPDIVVYWLMDDDNQAAEDKQGD
jgi:hypothetical protein